MTGKLWIRKSRSLVNEEPPKIQVKFSYYVPSNQLESWGIVKTFVEKINEKVD